MEKFMEKAKSGIAYVVLIHVNVAFVPDASLVSSQDTAASQVERLEHLSVAHISTSKPSDFDVYNKEKAGYARNQAISIPAYGSRGSMPIVSCL